MGCRLGLGLGFGFGFRGRKGGRLGFKIDVGGIADTGDGGIGFVRKVGGAGIDRPVWIGLGLSHQRWVDGGI